MVLKTRVLGGLVVAACAFGGILPEQWAGALRGPASTPPLTDRKVWEEFGLTEVEVASYKPDEKAVPRPDPDAPKPVVRGKPFSITAYRLRDVTSAMAAFQWQTPAGAMFPERDKLLARIGSHQLLVAEGNYLVRFEGLQPGSADVEALVVTFPRMEGGHPPVLPGYLPEEDLVSGSPRYVLGPESLAAFEPRLSPSLAAFHTGAEGQVASYRSEKGELRLVIFSYPTPAIARERLAEFSKLSSAMTKRSGSLIVTVLDPPDRDEAEKLLAKIRFQGQITWNERLATRRDNIGDLIINISILVAILLGFSIVAGLAVGGLRSLIRAARGGEEEEAMITLHLNR